MAVFNEDTRVKIPATIQFLRLGYEYQSLKDVDLHSETRIAINRFKPAIERINGRSFSDAEITALLDDIHAVIRNNDMGRAFYRWLINPQDKPVLVDFEHIENNNFAVIDELTFGKDGAENDKDGSFRPDITVLINGIPLAFLEVKHPNNEGGIQAEFHRMLNKRLEKPEYKKYFNMLQLVSFSNNMEYEDEDDSAMAEDVKAGSFYTTPNGFRTTFSFFREETPKTTGFLDISMDKIKAVLKDNHYSPAEADTPEFYTNLDMNTPCNRFVTSIFDKERIAYFLRYGITYVNGAVPEKHIMRYPQFFASKALMKRLDNGGKSGIIWHTQGSGKTELAAFSTRILRDYYAKKAITARFYYVVDRLDLLTQVSGEMSKRGLNVINVNSKSEFERELNKPVSDHVAANTDGEITVVNIQKFDDEMPAAKNDYNANIQRVIFIDEAHRSYRTDGEFFKNLLLVDRDAVYVALTGTPLLSKKERSNLKFGDYIHKYFYDKSIADGYTLRIKKESIETAARSEIKKNLELENPHVAKSDATESEDYIQALCKFVEKDFLYFRLINADETIGGMIVCSSNPQAKKIKKWFDDNSDLQAGLVISDDDIPASMNKQTQISFKETLQPDILVVHQMLTTGYDVNRLKKMYLIIWKTDRLSRDKIDIVLAKNHLRKCGVKIVYIAESIPDDIDDEMRELMESLYEGLAASFIAGHRKNVMRGLTYNAERALYNGVKVLGYTGKEDEKYQINPETAPIVKIIFDQYADGVPMQKICQSLKEQGLKTNNGNDFTINSLRRILTNSAYIGVYKWGEHTIPDGMPRIIDDDLFERVQRRLEKNKHGGKGAAKLVSDAEIADYWLTGHIYCGLCGETMQGISGTSKRGDKFHYYSCKGHRKHVCSMKNQRKDLLEKIVLHVLNEVVQNPAIRLQIAEKCYTYYMRQNADSGVYEASIKSQLRETDAKIKNLLKAIEAGVLTETTAERMKALESTKHRLEDALIAEQNRQKYQLKLEDIVKWLESFVGDLSDMHTRKEILDDYIGKILVYEDKLVVTFKYLDKQQSFKYAETSAMIDNCQAILDLFERKEYSGHVSEEMLASVMDESENPYFF